MPAAAGDGFLIYQGDCLSLMPRLPDDLFPLTVTSPPYNIGKEYETQRPIGEYLDWCGAWLDEVHRITRFNGGFWLNLGYVSMGGARRRSPSPICSGIVCRSTSFRRLFGTMARALRPNEVSHPATRNSSGTSRTRTSTSLIWTPCATRTSSIQDRRRMAN